VKGFGQIVNITFIVAKKNNLQFILLYLRYMWGGRWLKTSCGEGGGWLKMSKYHHMGEGSKVAQKNHHMIFERSLSALFR